MSDEERKDVIPSLNEFLLLPSQNWEQDLSSEQFFSLVLAYNDKITLKMRDKKKVSGRTAYALTDEEKTALELAFKSGVTGNFSEEDVVKKFQAFCCDEVSDVIGSNFSRKEKLGALHTLAVQKFLNYGGVANLGRYGYYAKVRNVADDLNSVQPKFVYESDCDFLENLATFVSDTDKMKAFAEKNNKTVDSQSMLNIDNAIQTTLELMYRRTYRSVSCVVGFDAYTQAYAQCKPEEEAV